jgi:ABC-type Fe3+/spermidine/putrescine transport system ATPase subunit
MTANVKLSARGLSMTFDADGKKVHVLDDIDLEVREGVFFCLLGPSVRS